MENSKGGGQAEAGGHWVQDKADLRIIRTKDGALVGRMELATAAYIAVRAVTEAWARGESLLAAPAPSEPLETSLGPTGERSREWTDGYLKGVSDAQSKALDASGKPLSGSEASPLEWTREKPTREGLYLRFSDKWRKGLRPEAYPVHADDLGTNWAKAWIWYGPIPGPSPRRVPAPAPASGAEHPHNTLRELAAAQPTREEIAQLITNYEAIRQGRALRMADAILTRFAKTGRFIPPN